MSYIHSLGALVRVELERENKVQIIEAELTRDRYLALQLAVGNQVYLQPKNVRVFAE